MRLGFDAPALDSNGFVRKAAERSLDLRRRGARDGGDRRKGLDQVVAQLNLYGVTHGKAAGDKTRALAMRLYEVVVGATVHDLRGVLTSAQSHLARLQGEAATPSPDLGVLRSGLGKVTDRLAYLERFVNDMATYSQAAPTERVPARLADVIRDAHGIAVDAINASGPRDPRVEASITVDDGITVVVAPYQIVTAISNVLKNAYEAVLTNADGERVGHISLMAACSGDGEVRIVIRDNGAGMNVDHLRDVRALVPGRTTKKGLGTGFGLPIAQRYIAVHGGSIALESAENFGTTVTIVLPIESQQELDR